MNSPNRRTWVLLIGRNAEFRALTICSGTSRRMGCGRGQPGVSEEGAGSGREQMGKTFPFPRKRLPGISLHTPAIWFHDGPIEDCLRFWGMGWVIRRESSNERAGPGIRGGSTKRSRFTSLFQTIKILLSFRSFHRRTLPPFIPSTQLTVFHGFDAIEQKQDAFSGIDNSIVILSMEFLYSFRSVFSISLRTAK